MEKSLQPARCTIQCQKHAHQMQRIRRVHGSKIGSPCIRSTMNEKRTPFLVARWLRRMWSVNNKHLWNSSSTTYWSTAPNYKLHYCINYNRNIACRLAELWPVLKSTLVFLFLFVVYALLINGVVFVGGAAFQRQYHVSRWRPPIDRTQSTSELLMTHDRIWCVTYAHTGRWPRKNGAH